LELGHLPDAGLQIAVAAYIMVICLTTSAKPWAGPAHWAMGLRGAWLLGACIFMASDALIAVNKFLAPVPLAFFLDPGNLLCGAVADHPR